MLFTQHHKIKRGKKAPAHGRKRGDVVKGHNSIKLGRVD